MGQAASGHHALPRGAGLEGGIPQVVNRRDAVLLAMVKTYLDADVNHVIVDGEYETVTFVVDASALGLGDHMLIQEGLYADYLCRVEVTASHGAS